MNYSKDQEKDDNGYSKVVSRSGYCSEDFSDGGGKYSSDDDDDDDGEIGDGKTICAAQETNNIVSFLVQFSNCHSSLICGLIL